MNLLDFIQNNLAHVLPILLVGVVAVAIILERFRTLVMRYPLRNAPAFFEKLQSLVVGGKTLDAISLCDHNSGRPAAKVAKAALLRAHLPDDAIEQAVMLAVGESTRVIQKRTGFLATIANVATLLGLLGTIAGLIQSFEAVSHADPQQKAAMLSAGIATAMNATMLGLGVAIPCMLAFSYLINQANSLVGEIEESAMKAMDILKLRHYIEDKSPEGPTSPGERPDHRGRKSA